jgi:hypothetical protein
VEAPLIPVCKEPVPKRGGLLSRIFYTGLFSGTNVLLEPVLKPFFLPVELHMFIGLNQILVISYFVDRTPCMRGLPLAVRHACMPCCSPLPVPLLTDRRL